MTSIFLIRHGENVDGKVNGLGPIVDLGLSAKGQDQVGKLSRRLASESGIKFQALLTSPERRAAETAQLISAALGLPAQASKEFEEWRSDDGTFEPGEFMALWQAIPERERAHHRVQRSSETQAEFAVRVGSQLQTVAQQYGGQSIGIVTHGGFIQAAFRHFFGFGDAAFRRAYPAAAHSSLTHWRQETGSTGSGRWILEFSNDASHLRSA